MNVYDPTTGFMRARKNGCLYQPFSPYMVDNNYTEANSWQYSFYMPHDVLAYLELLGSQKKMEEKLILDQPDQVTKTGKVEHNVQDDLPLNETSPQDDSKEKLLTEDPLAGVTIITD
jgi:putative alpha-1,2-mannosidase